MKKKAFLVATAIALSTAFYACEGTQTDDNNRMNRDNDDNIETSTTTGGYDNEGVDTSVYDRYNMDRDAEGDNMETGTTTGAEEVTTGSKRDTAETMYGTTAGAINR